MPLPPPPCRLENAGPTPEATWNPSPAPPPGRRPDASAAAAVLTAAQAAVLTPTVERRLTAARAGRGQDGGPGPRPAAVQRPDGGRTGLGCWVLVGITFLSFEQL